MIKHNGNPPPEICLYMGTLGGILVSLSKSHRVLIFTTATEVFVVLLYYPLPGLFCLAFTTYPHIHWIGPIIASVPFGTGILFVFTSSFTYLVTAYRPIAASAMAANSALRSTFAAVFPLFAVQMYHRLGTVGATALLAGLTTLMAPFPCVKLLRLCIGYTVSLTCLSCHSFILCMYGHRIRANSRFATHN